MGGRTPLTLNITSPPSTAALHRAPTAEEAGGRRESLSEGWLPQTRILNPRRFPHAVITLRETSDIRIVVNNR